MFEVIYEDNHLLVAYKPPGVLSQAADKDLPDMLTLAKEYLKEKYQKPGNVYLGLVHRLDLNVGGLMVFAKTSKAASRLSESIRNQAFDKRYYAVCEGSLDHDGELVDFLEKDTKQRISSSSKEGKESRLSYHVVAHGEYKNVVTTLLDIQLFTGRFHQIRSQFSSIGHPLLGDQKYGSAFQFPVISLFAYSISFPHPTKDERMNFHLVPRGKAFEVFSNTLFNQDNISK